MQMTYIYYQVVWLLVPFLLLFSMEHIHICISVCLRYVYDKKLSVFQSNVKDLKWKNIQKY